MRERERARRQRQLDKAERRLAVDQADRLDAVDGMIGRNGVEEPRRHECLAVPAVDQEERSGCAVRPKRNHQVRAIHRIRPAWRRLTATACLEVASDDASRRGLGVRALVAQHRPAQPRSVVRPGQRRVIEQTLLELVRS